MKTLINISKAIRISAAVVLFGGLSLSLSASDNSYKIYQVTGDGSFHFTYMETDVSNKNGVKPVTVRTFYLETMREGLLPSDLSYPEFLELTPEEIQDLINRAQRERLAAVEARKFHADKMGLPKLTAPNEIKCEPIINAALPGETPSVAEDLNEGAGADDELNLPWIVKVIVDPTDGYKMPDFKSLPSLPVYNGQQALIQESSPTASLLLGLK